MRQATTQGLYQYWNTVRGSRLAPRRYEIEPSQIVPYLSETIILEQPGADDCRIRVAGTQVCEWLGNDLRGEQFRELWSEQDWAILSENIGTITRHGATGLFTFAGEFDDEVPTAEFEMLLLPLTHLDDRIERILGCIAIRDVPAWIETSLPSNLKLLSNETIWPEGRPHALAQSRKSVLPATEIPSLRSDVRTARLVRRQRRSFLVYDGGLMDAARRDE